MLGSQCIGKTSRNKLRENLNLEETVREAAGQGLPTKKPRRNYSKPEYFERLMRGEDFVVSVQVNLNFKQEMEMFYWSRC